MIRGLLKCAVATCAVVALACGVAPPAAAQEGADVTLPEGVKAVWDMQRAYRESTTTRERICINGLWRWQPAPDAPEAVPAGGWGYFKVPGEWPRAYNRGGSRTLYPHPSWDADGPGQVDAAWHKREITVPPQWAGRRIVPYAEYVNSLAGVYLDDNKVGEIRFPWGEVDLTRPCRPGQTQVLSIHIQAPPLSAVTLAFTDTGTRRRARGVLVVPWRPVPRRVGVGPGSAGSVDF